jgi:hypothetical protein
MPILNYAHPLTEDQLHQIERLTGQPIDRIIELPAQIDTGQPLGPQVIARLRRSQ